MVSRGGCHFRISRLALFFSFLLLAKKNYFLILLALQSQALFDLGAEQVDEHERKNSRKSVRWSTIPIALK